jgi:hypothetical protein
MYSVCLQLLFEHFKRCFAFSKRAAAILATRKRPGTNVLDSQELRSLCYLASHEPINAFFENVLVKIISV